MTVTEIDVVVGILLPPINLSYKIVFDECLKLELDAYGNLVIETKSDPEKNMIPQDQWVVAFKHLQRKYENFFLLYNLQLDLSQLTHDVDSNTPYILGIQLQTVYNWNRPNTVSKYLTHKEYCHERQNVILQVSNWQRFLPTLNNTLVYFPPELRSMILSYFVPCLPIFESLTEALMESALEKDVELYFIQNDCCCCS
jgi:hypothetical protein